MIAWRKSQTAFWLNEGDTCSTPYSKTLICMGILASILPWAQGRFFPYLHCYFNGNNLFLSNHYRKFAACFIANGVLVQDVARVKVRMFL